MQGLWKSNIGKNFYSKDCKIKRNNRKHFLRDKARIVYNKKDKLSEEKRNAIFEKEEKVSNKEIVKTYKSFIAVPVVKAELYKKVPTNFDFKNCETCNIAKKNEGTCFLYNYSNIKHNNNFVCEKFNTNISHDTFYKKAYIYYDIFSEEKGFRDYYSNELLISEKEFKKSIHAKYYDFIPNAWLVNFEYKNIAGLKVPVAIGCETELEVIKPLEVTEFYKINNSCFLYRDKEFIYGKPMEPDFFDKYFGFKKTVCKRIANRKTRAKEKDWLKKVKKNPKVFDSSFPKDHELKKSIAWCVS